MVMVGIQATITGNVPIKKSSTPLNYHLWTFPETLPSWKVSMSTQNSSPSLRPHVQRAEFDKLIALRRPSWAPSLPESLEPRQPPPEYRHYPPYSLPQSRSSSESVSPGSRPFPYYGDERCAGENGEEDGDFEGEEEEEEEGGEEGEDGDGDGDGSEEEGGGGSTPAVARMLNSPERDRKRTRLSFGSSGGGGGGEWASRVGTRGRRGEQLSFRDMLDELGGEEERVEGGGGGVRLGSSTSSVPQAEIEPASPEFGGNMKRSLQIDMKDLVGDAVGNMSISPGSRDIVLAARRGLFIIDLEAPLEVPRFLPQGGTWDVADVQWNPHPSRAEYIVSTSAEKLLIWNLLLVGKTNIEHILQAHYRAITDTNWHTTECDTVVSTSIDSWLWAWDLREPRKPIFGLSAFKSGGTQVKWNRQDANILASSHGNEVYIWDRRKGSLPLTRIRAHSSKIYGIDWSHDYRTEIVTCSLDRSIKVWDINDSLTSNLYSRPSTNGASGPGSNRTSVIPTNDNPYFLSGSGGWGMYGEEKEYSIYGPVAQYEPKRIINTMYPVWRARNLPFGRGVLSLPQRSETALEMYALNSGGNGAMVDGTVPVEVFEGHTDVVKEFVWRRGDQDEFQLITWSKDRTLKFWPIDTEVMQKVGYGPEMSRGRSRKSDRLHAISFRNPPEGTGSERMQPHFGPVPSRSIFSEMRATLPQRGFYGSSKEAHMGVEKRPAILEYSSSGEGQGYVTSTKKTGSRPISVHKPPFRLRGETMSRGNVGGKSVARMDAFAWLSSVKVGEKRGSSSGPGSREREKEKEREKEEKRTGSRSRFSSTSRRVEVAGAGERVEKTMSPTGHVTDGTKTKRSESRSRTIDSQEALGQSLQDEITTVLTKLAASKIKLEKHELTKKRTCTLGLHGPWGDSSQVFIRVTFTFPRDYPHASYPHGIPTVELERNPLISIRNRAFMLRRLRGIRERRRPCLEACLRFLLFADEEEQAGPTAIHLDSDSSDGEEGTGGALIVPDGGGGGERKKKAKAVPAISMLRNHKNLAEPRTSQGTFGPNGELVCFFRAPPRIVRNVLRGLSNPNLSVNDMHAPPMSPARPPEDLPIIQQQEQDVPSLLRSSALVADAVWKLGVAAKDRGSRSPSDGRRPATDAGGDIFRVMTNLLVFVNQKKVRRDSDGSHQEMSLASAGIGPDAGAGALVMGTLGGVGTGSGARGEARKNFALSATRSTVFLASTNEVAGPDRQVAVGYVYDGRGDEEGLVGVCEKNAKNARACGRYDHERVFRALKTLFFDGKEKGEVNKKEIGKRKRSMYGFALDVLAKQVIMKLYADFAKNKDVQMLAMLSVLVLQTRHCSPELLSLPLPLPGLAPYTSSSTPTMTRPIRRTGSGSLIPPIITTSSLVSTSPLIASRIGPVDYFNLARAINAHAQGPPSSPDWPRLPTSPIMPPPALPLPLPITASTSKGSWSTLFGTGGVRQFVQDTFNKDGVLGDVSLGIGGKGQHQAEGSGSGSGSSSGTVGMLHRSGSSSGFSVGGVAGSGGKGVAPEASSIGGVSASQQQQQQQQQRRKKQRKDSIQHPQQQPPMLQPQHSSTSTSTTKSSWNYEVSPLRPSMSFSSASSSSSAGGLKRSPLAQVENVDWGHRGMGWGGGGVPGGWNWGREGGRDRDMGRRALVVDVGEEESPPPLFDGGLVEQFKAHVNAYAEILHRWKMDHQRLELLKAVSGNVSFKQESATYGVNVAKVCTVCLTTVSREKSICPTCGSFCGGMQCSVCRLPVKGLSRTCLLCFHVTHVSCLRKINVPICPTGCGCICESGYSDLETASQVASHVQSHQQQQQSSTRASSMVRSVGVQSERDAESVVGGGGGALLLSSPLHARATPSSPRLQGPVKHQRRQGYQQHPQGPKDYQREHHQQSQSPQPLRSSRQTSVVAAAAGGMPTDLGLLLM
ncbi:hypothetical protein AX17_005860 [Amanita inopinata Kibby_2008]|nr:hypothetical protein AX17_005860 [Amanita inopinata Kibby_2008]